MKNLASTMRNLALLVIVLTSLLVGACSSQATAPSTTASTAQPQNGGRLRVMITAGPGSAIGWPAEALGPSAVYNKPCIESLLFQDPNGIIKPWLATEWKIATDQKSITFTLRKGVKFHDGSDFNSQAVKFNLEAAKAGKLSGTDVWSSVDVIDDYTVKLNITSFQNTIFNILCLSAGAMVSPTAYNTKGLDFVRANPVGTGAFKFNSFQRDVALKYDKFTDYWQKDKPYLDGIDYIIVADPMTQLAAFQSGEADVLSGAQVKSASELKTKGYQIISQPTNTVCLIPDSNNPNSPLSKTQVRQAIEYAINKEAIVNALGYGFWLPNYQLAAANMSVYLTDITARKYDMTKAKQLLTDAGYPSGFDTRIIPDPQSANTDAVLAMQADLKKIGINASIETVNTAAYTEYRTKGWSNGLLCMAIGVVVPNAAQGLQSNFASNIFPSLKRPATYSSALDEALVATDAAAQKTATQKALRAMYDDEAIIPVYSGVSCYALQNNVHDTGFLTTSHFTIWAYYNAWLSK